MIFIFLENENEIVKKVSKMMFQRDFQRDFFLIIFKISLVKVSELKHFIGIFNVSERFSESREIFL